MANHCVIRISYGCTAQPPTMVTAECTYFEPAHHDNSQCSHHYMGDCNSEQAITDKLREIKL